MSEVGLEAIKPPAGRGAAIAGMSDLLQAPS